MGGGASVGAPGGVPTHGSAGGRTRLEPRCGAVRIGEVECEVAAREKAGTLHAARLPGAEGLLTTDRAVADERETVALMRADERRGAAPIRARAVDKARR